MIASGLKRAKKTKEFLSVNGTVDYYDPIEILSIHIYEDLKILFNYDGNLIYIYHLGEFYTTFSTEHVAHYEGKIHLIQMEKMDTPEEVSLKEIG